LTATVFLGKLQRRENLMVAFQHFDSDGSGFITEEELLMVRGRTAGDCCWGLDPFLRGLAGCTAMHGMHVDP
jgi:hypothetical protein